MHFCLLIAKLEISIYCERNDKSVKLWKFLEIYFKWHLIIMTFFSCTLADFCIVCVFGVCVGKLVWFMLFFGKSWTRTRVYLLRFTKLLGRERSGQLHQEKLDREGSARYDKTFGGLHTEVCKTHSLFLIAGIFLRKQKKYLFLLYFLRWRQNVKYQKILTFISWFCKTAIR